MLRVDVQGLAVVFDRLCQLALISAHITQIVLGDRRFRVRRKGMGPELLRVVPDVDLVPGEDSQAKEDAGDKSGTEERSPSPPREQAGTGQERPGQACEVGVSIRGNLRAALDDP